MSMLHDLVKREEQKWKRAKEEFGWTLRSLESWPSFDWPEESKQFIASIS
jgi:hypothetical protein